MKKIKSFNEFLNESKDLKNMEWYDKHTSLSHDLDYLIAKMKDLNLEISGKVTAKELTENNKAIVDLIKASKKYKDSL